MIKQLDGCSTLAPRPSAAKHWIAVAQPALHFGGEGNFYEPSFDDVIVLIQAWYNSRKRSQICAFLNISENENLLS